MWVPPTVALAGAALRYPSFVPAAVSVNAFGGWSRPQRLQGPDVRRLRCVCTVAACRPCEEAIEATRRFALHGEPNAEG